MSSPPETPERSTSSPPAAPMRVTLAQLPGLVGTELPTTVSVTADQARIDGFADVTEDHQWLHVDPDRAAKGPFGTTIAHGYLTLSLIPGLLWTVFEVTDAAQVVNYGLGKVRFPAPVPSGSSISMRTTIRAVDPVKDSLQVTLACSLFTEGATRPACVAEVIFRYYGQAAQ